MEAATKDIQPIIVENIYNAPTEKVWRALTDKTQMKEWYFNLEAFRPEVGFEFQFYGQGHKGEQYLHLCRVTESVKNKKLAYTWKYDGFRGESLVSFELKDIGGKTKLILTHSGLHTFPTDNPDFAKESFMGGWTELIGSSLKRFVE
jgi:uncharacterized protein YndB with AHSA1/START domain